MTLIDSAFGSGTEVGRTASDERVAEQWYRAVVLGATGRFAMAAHVLDGMVGDHRGDDLTVSLALSTRGSLLRQQGRHREAAPLDSRALRLSASEGGGADRAGLRHAARADALVGVAADALGYGDFTTCRRLMSTLDAEIAARCPGDRDPRVVMRSEVGPAANEPADRLSHDLVALWITGERLAVRAHWLAAEYHLYTGYLDGCGSFDEAAEHAGRACDLAAVGPSVRHRVKSVMIRAAAESARGRHRQAYELAEQAHAGAVALGLGPIAHAARALLHDLPCGSER
ncbi:hypothetical protein GCM10027169_04940 [Gordonia jinhuaensis]|uniref:Tetratricopeptide repeat-containing protein n=1 Tax=Gordonia jinhuaensis TaxID=1517702 RepID=A0A916SWW1_9ACTN|nr:hypothetical protein [Gordonia jinhuaensis]GGB17439.1 hypothetical protein GCM10011489_01900 [Gordonia jinhuaensis]